MTAVQNASPANPTDLSMNTRWSNRRAENDNHNVDEQRAPHNGKTSRKHLLGFSVGFCLSWPVTCFGELNVAHHNFRLVAETLEHFLPENFKN